MISTMMFTSTCHQRMQKENFWIPKFVFGNSELNLQIPIDSKAKVLVKRKGTQRMADKYHLRETAYFLGSENPILLSRDFTLKFKCDFNLQYFPFDTQSCMILLNANNKVQNFVQLTPILQERCSTLMLLTDLQR